MLVYEPASIAAMRPPTKMAITELIVIQMPASVARSLRFAMLVMS